MPLVHFVISSFIGGAIRASIFAYFGNALTQASWTSLAAPVALFGFALAVPLAFPSGRLWLRDLLARPVPAAAVSQPIAGEAGSAPNRP
jgi:membrane protein DedA with SNARE-associated domain